MFAYLNISRLLIASVLVAVLGLGGSMLLNPGVDMRIEPSTGVFELGEEVVVQIIVESDIPVNVFKGELRFDSSVLSVASINYNTTIAELWAERPWFSNGDGTLNFIGGTTRPGGFTGSGNLITVIFETNDPGNARLSLNEVRILQHDGLGTDAIVNEPVDAIFTVNEQVIMEGTVLQKSTETINLAVREKPPSTDLNNDGKQSIADVSIFMQHLALKNLLSDFNQDGKVNTADLSIILNAK